ncbi:MAG TPA: PKD domain-containing protein, partial [Pirellulaceae bacterium]
MAFTRGAFVNADGTSTPEFQIHGPFSTAGGNGSFEVGLASNGTDALVVQSQELSSGVETDLLAHMVHADGSVSPMVHLTPWSGNQYKPHLAWDGVHFLVAYHDQKARIAPYTLDELDARSDLYAMRISPSGAIVDPQGFLFSALAIGETDPSIVANNGITVLAASHMMNDPVHANYRVVYQQMDGNNQWPVAVAHASPVDGDVPLAVSFSASGSVDIDGSIASYQWDFGNGITSADENPSFIYTTPGQYSVQLTVTDNLGAQTIQALAVRATAPNQIPVAVANASVYSGNAPLEVNFNSDGSYDPDGVVGNIEWRISDGTTYYGSLASHTFAIPGTYNVELAVYDVRGGVGTTTLQIQVGGNLPGDFDGNGQLDALD